MLPIHGHNTQLMNGAKPMKQNTFHGITIISYIGIIQHQQHGNVRALSNKLIGPKPKQQSKGNMAQKYSTFG